MSLQILFRFFITTAASTSHSILKERVLQVLNTLGMLEAWEIFIRFCKKFPKPWSFNIQNQTLQICPKGAPGAVPKESASHHIILNLMRRIYFAYVYEVWHQKSKFSKMPPEELQNFEKSHFTPSPLCCVWMKTPLQNISGAKHFFRRKKIWNTGGTFRWILEIINLLNTLFEISNFLKFGGDSAMLSEVFFVFWSEFKHY